MNNVKVDDETISNILDTLSMSRLSRGSFHGAYPFVSGAHITAKYDDAIMFPMDVTQNDLAGRLDISILGGLLGKNVGYHATRVRVVGKGDRKRLRGILPQRDVYGTRSLVELQFGYASENGKGFVDKRWLRISDARRPLMEVIEPADGGLCPGKMQEVVALAAGVQFCKPMYWQVGLQIDDGPMIRFFTDPHGAAQAFRLRDVAPGRSRRAALCHWVGHHWRRNRADDGLHEVRRHLRGATTFTWNGLTCAIEPAKDDLAALLGE